MTATLDTVERRSAPAEEKEAVSAAYARRAAEYIDALGSMQGVHPADRVLVEEWSDTLTGPVLDAGCGPGHWTDHLARRLAPRGLAVRGIDRVPVFVEHARERYPDAAFDIGDLEALDAPDGSLGGILSWYSTIHHAPSRIAISMSEFARALAPGGGLLLGYFDGARVESFDHAITGAYRWPAEALGALLEAAGFDVIETHRRTGPAHRPHGAIVCRKRATTSEP